MQLLYIAPSSQAILDTTMTPSISIILVVGLISCIRSLQTTRLPG
jgi:hypothetical protein